MRQGIEGPRRRFRPLFWALIIGVVAVSAQALGTALAAAMMAIWGSQSVRAQGVAWALLPGSALAVVAGLLGAIDLFVLLPHKRRQREVRREPLVDRDMTVALTALNDDQSIAPAVRDFRGLPYVRRVLVVDNDSRDDTAAAAARAGAVVSREETPGYGACVYRALTEAASYQDVDFILLCEGDGTFRAEDADKFLAYAQHGDIVNGTRIVEQLRSPHTQLTTFMYYGNFFVGKLLEARHLGAGTFTDIGTTYKLCRRQVVVELLPHLNPAINLEFNAHFLDTALARGYEVLECPITFHARVGESKGGNVNNWRAFVVGMRMIRGLMIGWPSRRDS